MSKMRIYLTRTEGGFPVLRVKFGATPRATESAPVLDFASARKATDTPGAPNGSLSVASVSTLRVFGEPSDESG